MKLQETTTKIHLIDGKFSPLDAANMLFTMLADKIKFHQLQEFSGTVRTPDQTAHAAERITSLQNDKSTIRDVIIHARNSGYHLKIKGSIEIELCK